MKWVLDHIELIFFLLFVISIIGIIIGIRNYSLEDKSGPISKHRARRTKKGSKTKKRTIGEDSSGRTFDL